MGRPASTIGAFTWHSQPPFTDTGPAPARPGAKRALFKGEAVRIKQIISQYRRDFTAEYECEHCGYTYKGNGYDDTNFHVNVVPNFECKKCGKRAGEEYRPLTTKYPDYVTV